MFRGGAVVDVYDPDSRFWVLDHKTGKEADPYEIALHEDWACGLMYCDMEGFAILEDDALILMDECGKYVYCDPERFEVIWNREKLFHEALKMMEKCENQVRLMMEKCDEKK